MAMVWSAKIPFCQVRFKNKGIIIMISLITYKAAADADASYHDIPLIYFNKSV